MLLRLLIIVFLHLLLVDMSVAQSSANEHERLEKAIKQLEKQAPEKNRTSKNKVDNRSKQWKRVKTISKGSAIHFAKSEVNGKVLSAKLINSKGPAVYRVKMLVGDSRVRTVFVDGVTGRVIKIN